MASTEDNFSQITAINYWQQAPTAIGFLRKTYLNHIMSYFNSRLVKVLLGQRRSGKSVILKQIIAQLLANQTKPENILYLNFELHQLYFVNDAQALLAVIEQYIKYFNPQGKIYFLFDEIQEVAGWEKAVNSYAANERYDLEIIITGSNAHLLSTELSTLVTGRYIEIPVFPFSYTEFISLKEINAERHNLINYIQDTGVPAVYSLTEESQKINYFSGLKDSIIMNDIVNRFNIRQPKLLSLLLDFIIDNIGHLFSFSTIVNKLKNNGIHINAITISNYLDYLERTFLIHAIRRYDLRGKRILEGERKYYLNDLGFVNYYQSGFEPGINRKLENFVYLTLIQQNYTVYVGNLQSLEIDFIAEKNQQVIYIQVCYLLHDEETIKREYTNLQKISDNWPKWIVSLDEVAIAPRDGILHIPAWQLAEHLT